MKKIVIIGGAGFIGHNLALALVNEKFKVEIIDNLEINNLGSLKKNINNLPYPKLSKKILNERLFLLKKNKILLHKQDAKDFLKIQTLLDKIQPNIIIHLAAVSHANRSNKDPHTTFENSFKTLEHVLEYSKNKVDHFIFSSSSMVYGNFNNLEAQEDQKCSPIGIYGALKYASEKLIISYNQVFDLPYTIIRPSALYGERCISRRVGQIFIESALNGSKIMINGDGKEKLDFTYIDDLVQGFIKAVKNKKSYNQIFNLTFGKSRSILEMMEILKDEFPNIQIEKIPRDKLMPIRGTLSIDKAKELLNFDPKWPLEKGYPKYINWYNKIFSS